MNSADICKKEFETAFNRIKQQRDASAVESYEKELHLYTATSFFDFGGDEYSSYSFLMHDCELVSYNALCSILCNLLKDKNPISYRFKNEKEFFIAIPISEFSLSGYYFKDFGIPTPSQYERFSSIVNSFLEKGVVFNELKFVCLVSDSAEKAIFNNDHNSQLISLKDFFRNFLSENDYEILKNEEIKFTENVKKYLSISIVRTLSPNALFGFKQTVEFMIKNFNYEKYIDSSITTNQIRLMKDQFINNKFYKTLLGKSDFSISFLTAEWLYDSLQYAGIIDFTAIAMGYFKAIEQLLYAFISLHTKEKDPHNRKVYVIKKGIVTLDNGIISHDKDAITLQSLTSFFGYYNFKTNTVESRNTDLLCKFIDKSATYNAIVKMFSAITEIRNGYFHKDNITSWETVEKARNTAYVFFFYFLGSYQISETEKIELNIPIPNDSNDFFRLCEYTHYHSRSIYYLFFDDGSKFVCFSSYDNGITFNQYGDITYSGIYLRNIKWAKIESFIMSVSDIKSNRIDKGEPMNVTEQDLLKCNIFVGDMKPVSEGMMFSGAKTKIYDHGRFCEPIENDRPSY